MKKLLSIIFILLIFVCPFSMSSEFVYAIDGEIGENYVIYNENNEILCEKSSVEVGDTFITRDFNEYEIISLENHTAKAKLIRKIEIPQITREKFIAKDKLSQRGELSKKICLYLTHNDESYRPTDGYDSIYGAGGVHDVARQFKNELNKKDIQVVLDETLHIPHDSSAYSRSAVTAKNLLNDERPDAIFDVHRDGVSKSFYYYNDGEEGYSKIRIVVGKANPNYDENYKFAQKVFAIGNSMYPWLFSDIYCGKGHYNQELQPTDLLFEMGTYLIEKEYVFNTLPLLADVIDTTLYASINDGDGNITVDQDAPETNNTPVIITPPNSTNGSLDSEIANENTQNAQGKGWIIAMIFTFTIVAIMSFGGIVLYKKDKN